MTGPFDPTAASLRPFTPGARRALLRAARLAAALHAPATDVRHLASALLGEESRAQELLARAGLDEAALATHSLFAGFAEAAQGTGTPRADGIDPATRPSGTTADAHVDSAPVASLAEFESPPSDAPQALDPPADELLRAVLHESVRSARSVGVTGEVGSEHLLCGILVVASPAADLLRAAGLSLEAVTTALGLATGSTTAPLDDSVELSRASDDRGAAERTDVLRILDAAANRAREGLRVIEDYVRFGLDDAHLTEVLKTCRHELSQALARIDPVGRLFARDTLHDVGTRIGTAAEGLRRSSLDVLRANFARVAEACRTLEEFGKTLSPDLGSALEACRYSLYTVEKGVLATRLSRERLAGRVLYLLVAESACPHGSGPVIRAALAHGAGIVQIREKTLPDRLLLEHARRVREWTRAAGGLLIVNDRPDLAVLCDADGVHVGQEELTVRDARRIVGPERLVGVSTHSLDQARQAVRDGADYLGVGPVFPSQTKTFAEFPGLELVRQVAAEITLPWYAIGGIGLDNVAAVAEAGAQRIAVGNAVCAADDPAAATAALRAALAKRSVSCESHS